jgi:hypothetical protein
MAIWTILARRHLEQALARSAARQGESVVGDTCQHLDEILRRSFPGATVIVQRQYVGFRRRQDEFVLLVEVTDGDAPGRYVVKIGPPERLRIELAAWQSCRPPGLRQDVVFMPLEPRPPFDPADVEHANKGEPVSLVYGDAQQFIGVQDAVYLEDAFLDAVRYGSPVPSSIGLVLTQLLERIGHLLYSRSWVDDPGQDDFVLDVPWLWQRMRTWEESPEALRVRRQVNSFAGSARGQFRDPVDYLRFVEEHVAWETAPPAPRAAMRSRGEGPGPQIGNMPRDSRVQKPARPGSEGPRPADLLPRMLRGCSHGDLHGRNVLVGVVRHRALWPAVFDYEHMSPHNLLGWDFVKLETELKLRAWLHLFSSESDSRFIQLAQQFEIDLDQETERSHGSSRWPVLVDDSEPATRLRSLLLLLRHQASLHLGADRGRPRDWLDEYYFLMMCYGVVTVGYDNLSVRERLGAYLSAGVSTGRFLWLREDQLMERLHPAGARRAAPAARTAPLVGRRCPCCHYPVSVAQALTAAGGEALLAAIELLRDLHQRHPHALACGHELVLALLETGRAEDRAEALARLQQLQREFPDLDEETLCRLGRLHKEAGERALDPAAVELDFRLALDWYGRAYGLRRGHYPGINLATLYLLLAGVARRQQRDNRDLLAQAEAQARDLLERRGEWSRERSDDTIWHLATAAEAYLVQQQWERAAAEYRRATEEPNFEPLHAHSILKQLRRLLDAFAQLGIEPVPPLDPDALLKPAAERP